MVLVEYGGILGGVRAEGEINEVDGTGCLEGGKGSRVMGFQERGNYLVLELSMHCGEVPHKAHI